MATSYTCSEIEFRLLEVSYKEGELPDTEVCFTDDSVTGFSYTTLSRLVDSLPYVHIKQPFPSCTFADLLEGLQDDANSISGSLFVDKDGDDGYEDLKALTKENYELWKEGKHKAFVLYFKLNIYDCVDLTVEELKQALNKEKQDGN